MVGCCDAKNKALKFSHCHSFSNKQLTDGLFSHNKQNGIVLAQGFVILGKAHPEGGTHSSAKPLA
jgi:hypothetical protein